MNYTSEGIRTIECAHAIVRIIVLFQLQNCTTRNSIAQTCNYAIASDQFWSIGFL